MLQQLLNRSPDIQKLINEGYCVEIRMGHLIVNDIPYVSANCDIKYGAFVSTLALAGDATVKPDTHVIHFVGDYPCDNNGNPLEKIRHQSQRREIFSNFNIDHSFSSKPAEGYSNYFEKIEAYANILSGYARAINVSVTPKNFKVFTNTEVESVFKYIDTATTRAEIQSISKKLALKKIAIIGLGGTGSYVLDLVSKTPVVEIHLFDGDLFLQHNAFRSPGAASIEELSEKPFKTEYYQKIYSKMRNGLISHAVYLDKSNVEVLWEMDFVFICIDRGSLKKPIIDKLHEFGISFIDVGMGVYRVDNSLSGIVRVTTSTKNQNDHVKNRVSFEEGNLLDEYKTNIQIVDLNAFNAVLAVIKWKKILTFYLDLEKEHNSTYPIDGNRLINEDKDET